MKVSFYLGKSTAKESPQFLSLFRTPQNKPIKVIWQLFIGVKPLGRFTTSAQAKTYARAYAKKHYKTDQVEFKPIEGR